MLAKPNLSRLPIALSELRRHRLRCARYIRPGWSGAHLTRRRGQSLEFRELQQYQIGGDLRHIDWHASARQGSGWAGVQSWMERRFEAEDQLTVAISLDTRSTMWLPRVEDGSISKLTAGAWACEALAYMVLSSKSPGDRVLIHQLYGYARKVARFSGVGSLPRIQRELRLMVETDSNNNPSTNLRAILPHLPPTAVWIVFTDLYFINRQDSHSIINALIEARRGNRWVILVELDSWPFEAKLFEELHPGKILGPNSEPTKIPVDQNSIAQAKEYKDKKLMQLRTRLKDEGIRVETWLWPATRNPDFKNCFRDWLFKTEEFKNLLGRESW